MINVNHRLFARSIYTIHPAYVNEENGREKKSKAVYLMEAAMEDSLHLIIIKCGPLDLPTGILVIK